MRLHVETRKTADPPISRDDELVVCSQNALTESLGRMDERHRPLQSLRTFQLHMKSNDQAKKKLIIKRSLKDICTCHSKSWGNNKSPDLPVYTEEELMVSNQKALA